MCFRIIRTRHGTRTDPSQVQGREYNILYNDDGYGGDSLINIASYYMQFQCTLKGVNQLGVGMIIFLDEQMYHYPKHQIDRGKQISPHQ